MVTCLPVRITLLAFLDTIIITYYFSSMNISNQFQYSIFSIPTESMSWSRLVILCYRFTKGSHEPPQLNVMISLASFKMYT